jgi:hypothetical protein
MYIVTCRYIFLETRRSTKEGSLASEHLYELLTMCKALYSICLEGQGVVSALKNIGV